MDHSTTTDETIVTLPWDQLHDSPLQYRKTYSQAAIDEIEATIRDTGRIHQPLVVRRRFPNPLFRDQYDPQDGYEIVFGHTRKRGGMAAGLAGGPCVIRDLNDAQVRAAQAAENIARSDVHALEEAEGFRVMIDEDGITADELAAQLGKSKSYVYARLKLLALCPQVRQAVLAGEIGTEVGLLIARVGGPKLQAKALGYIKAKYYDLEDGGKKSFRQIRDLLNERFTLELKAAIFDIEDEMLVPAAGHCLRCPKRSGNAPEFSDLMAEQKGDHYSRHTLRHSGADVCTDPDCFEAKKRAHLAREAAKLEAQGKTVVVGNKARAAMSAVGEVKGAYVELGRVRDVLKQAKKAAAAAGVAEPTVVLIQDQRTGKTVQAVKRDDLMAAGAKVPETTRSNGYTQSPAEVARRKAEQLKREQDLADENASRRALLDQVRTAMHAAERSAFDLQLVARAAYAGVQWCDKPLLADLWGCATAKGGHDADEALTKRLESLSTADLTRFVLDCALVADVQLRDMYYADDKPEALISAAKHYGIETASTPTAAARAADSPAAGAKKRKSSSLKTTDAGASAEPELPLGDQEDDAGSAGGSAGQVDAFEEAGA